MPKCRLKVHIKNDEINKTTEVNAIYQDNKIQYLEEDNTKVLFDYENNILIRENDFLRMRYRFNENDGVIEMKELQKMLPINLKTKNINKNNKNVEIEFYVEENPFLYKIEEII